MMNRLNCILAFAMCALFSSCQKRTLCSIQLKTGGTSYYRVYANTYDSPDDYKAAINELKAEGYICDDSSVDEVN